MSRYPSIGEQMNAMPTNRGLYDPRFDHDACGVAFVARIAGGPAHEVVQSGLQALINMASSLHLMPTKGMTLPFISYGGSSLLALALAMGMFLSLTRRRSGDVTADRSHRWAAGGRTGHCGALRRADDVHGGVCPRARVRR